MISDCCTDANPCNEGEGDCDDDSECNGDLVCGSNNCAKSLFPSEGTDCCRRPYGNADNMCIYVK